jgi:hypothetical protein
MIAQESKRGDSRNARPRVTLDWRLEKSLSAYASAALAAGVGLLAMTGSAEAKIVYTAAHTNIPVNNKSAVPLDLNHDGIADFSFQNLEYLGGSGSIALDLAVGCAVRRVTSTSSTCKYQSNMVWGQGVVSGRFASALPADFTVGANKAYFQQAQKRRSSYVRGPVASMAGFQGTLSSTTTGGQWMHTRRRYLGFRFIIDGEIHYGWARVNVNLTNAGRGITATLTGYAYETIPNKPIITGKTKGPDVITPEPASLGQLAQGASGISAWREKK